jgi:hypothetical protein
LIVGIDKGGAEIRAGKALDHVWGMALASI